MIRGWSLESASKSMCRKILFPVDRSDDETLEHGVTVYAAYLGADNQKRQCPSVTRNAESTEKICF